MHLPLPRDPAVAADSRSYSHGSQLTTSEPLPHKCRKSLTFNHIDLTAHAVESRVGCQRPAANAGARCGRLGVVQVDSIEVAAYAP